MTNGWEREREITREQRTRRITGRAGEQQKGRAIKTGADLGGFPYPTEAEHMNK